MDLPYERALKLIEHAMEEEQKEFIFRLYLVDKHQMKKFMTFSDYYEKYRPTKYEIDNRPKDEIIKEVERIKKKVG